jgi:ribosome-binding protein aMBF1 (putative translation factor)
MRRKTIEHEGKTFVLVPEEAYDRMIDDLEALGDIRAYDRAVATKQEFIPLSHVKRLVEGDESPILVWREYRGLTQTRLARQVGISVPFLSQLEHARREPSLSVLRRLAAALAVDLDDLVPVKEPGS